MTAALTEFVGLLVGGITALATGVAQGVSTMASTLFLATSQSGEVTGLSAFGGIAGIFAGISLAVGITTRVFIWVQSLGH